MKGHLVVLLFLSTLANNSFGSEFCDSFLAKYGSIDYGFGGGIYSHKSFVVIDDNYWKLAVEINVPSIELVSKHSAKTNGFGSGYKTALSIGLDIIGLLDGNNRIEWKIFSDGILTTDWSHTSRTLPITTEEKLIGFTVDIDYEPKIFGLMDKSAKSTTFFDVDTNQIIDYPMNPLSNLTIESNSEIIAIFGPYYRYRDTHQTNPFPDNYNPGTLDFNVRNKRWIYSIKEISDFFFGDTKPETMNETNANDTSVNPANESVFEAPSESKPVSSDYNSTDVSDTNTTSTPDYRTSMASDNQTDTTPNSTEETSIDETTPIEVTDWYPMRETEPHLIPFYVILTTDDDHKIHSQFYSHETGSIHNHLLIDCTSELFRAQESDPKQFYSPSETTDLDLNSSSWSEVFPNWPNIPTTSEQNNSIDQDQFWIPDWNYPVFGQTFNTTND